MKKYIIKGGNKLSGTISVTGAKNVVTKAIVAAALTSEEVIIENVPLISDLDVAISVAEGLGATVEVVDHMLKIRYEEIKNIEIPLEAGAKSRTAAMFLGPLLIRKGEAIVPNPGGCRLGARPIDRHIEGLEKMGAAIDYLSDDGYFHAKSEKLKGANYTFEKNTHTGTETLILAAVLAEGATVLENAAEEPEVDDLMNLLNQMGGNVKRTGARTITIEGVASLHGTTYKIMPDRNEAVTFAIMGALTGGEVWIKNANMGDLASFLVKFEEAGGAWEEKDDSVRFYIKDKIKATDMVTGPHPAFMTDWQGPWSVLATQAEGESTIHETVYENRFAYVSELKKMGAKLDFYNPTVANPREFYNFNFEDEEQKYKNQGLKINGPTKLHNAVLDIADLRAGATLVIACLIAKGASIVYGFEHIERGYEAFDTRIRSLGASIVAIPEEVNF